MGRGGSNNLLVQIIQQLWCWTHRAEAARNSSLQLFMHFKFGYMATCRFNHSVPNVHNYPSIPKRLNEWVPTNNGAKLTPKHTSRDVHSHLPVGDYCLHLESILIKQDQFRGNWPTCCYEESLNQKEHFPRSTIHRYIFVPWDSKGTSPRYNGIWIE